jgi:hypothetical protein
MSFAPSFRNKRVQYASPLPRFSRALNSAAASDDVTHGRAHDGCSKTSSRNLRAPVFRVSCAILRAILRTRLALPIPWTPYSNC